MSGAPAVPGPGARQHTRTLSVFSATGRNSLSCDAPFDVTESHVYTYLTNNDSGVVCDIFCLLLVPVHYSDLLRLV